MSRLIIILLFIIHFNECLFGCRIWAVISKNDLALNMATEQEMDYVGHQLNALFDQSQYNQNGWAVIRYSQDTNLEQEPIYRSQLAANQDSINYWANMNMVFETELNDIGIAHIRAATSGASSIPNPHPWVFENEKTYSFVHNGGASKELLYDLITDNGMDESWLDQNPPQTFGAGDWRHDGWNSVVDSELIMLFIMRQIEIHGEVISGLESAFSLMIEAGISPYMLNCVFSDSESLYIYGGSNGLKFSESESLYSVMSSPPENSLSYQWESISTGELIVLKNTGVIRYPGFAVVQNNDPEILVPQRPELFPAYPNPFNGQVVIPFKALNDRLNSISIFNISGIEVYNNNLSLREIESGQITWRPNSNINQSLSTGVYIIKMVSGLDVQTSKIMFIK